MRLGSAVSLRSHSEGIPSWIGLSLTGLYLALVLALGAISLWAYREEIRSTNNDHLIERVEALARCIKYIGPGGGIAAVDSELRKTARNAGFQRCEIVDRNGRVLASSEPSRIGMTQPEELVTELIGISESAPARLTSDKTDHALYAVRLSKSFSAAATSPNASPAQAKLAWLIVESPSVRGVWTAVQWWSTVGYVALAGMGVFWVLYRMACRSLRPMATIRQRLLSTNGALEEQLALLRVNDSMDQAATAWNRLIESVGQMREELQTAHLGTVVHDTLNSYRSARLAAVLRHMPYGVLVVEGDEQVSFANRAAARMLGKTEDDLISHDLKTILPETIQTGLRVSGRGTARWVDYTFEQTAESNTVRFIMVPLDKDSTSAGNVVFMQDVSQFKEVERARDAFLYHVTHELRTPLTNIKAYTETLAGGVLDDPGSIRECYNVISGETERLGRLVEAILNVSQLEVGTARLHMGDVYVDRMIRDAVQDAQATADAKGVDLRLRLPPKLPVIRGDKERLSVVMANLLGNAIKYTPSGGHVEVTCSLESSPDARNDSQTVKVMVKDSGIGIDPAHHEKIFEKFYRVNDERVELQPGTGLGLSIVKETIRLHGGTICVESSEGRGAIFTVLLPVSSEKAEHLDRAQAVKAGA